MKFYFKVTWEEATAKRTAVLITKVQAYRH